MTAQYEKYQKETDDLMDLKFKLSDMERKANEENNAAKRKYEEQIADFDNDIAYLMRCQHYQIRLIFAPVFISLYLRSCVVVWYGCIITR